MKKSRMVCVLCVCLLQLSYLNAVNAVTLYTDWALFDDQLEVSVTDAYDSPGYLTGDIQNASTLHVHSNASMNAVVGETQYQPTGHPDTNVISSSAVSFYCAGCNGSFLLDFTTTSVGDTAGVFGVGFDFNNNAAEGAGYHAFVTFGDSSTIDYVLPIVPASLSLTEFWGITSDFSISSIHFGLINGGTTTDGFFAIDDLTIGSSVVPIPAALWLFASGLLGLIGIARRKRT